MSTRIALTASGTLGSLYRVLFTIRSCYLCTIGFTKVFSLRGVTSPVFKLHSERALLDCTSGTLKDISAMQFTGLSPSVAGLFQAGLKHCRICQMRHCTMCIAPHSVSSQSGIWHRSEVGQTATCGFLSLRSLLLRQSQLLSFPVSTDMLKSDTYL